MPTLEVQYGNDYPVAADGQRFLVNTLLARGISPLTVVMNWSAAQRRE